MLGLNKKEVILSAHDDWANQYRLTKMEIEAILGDNIIGIYHIGSTAIKVIVAKPVLDIAVAIKSVEQLNIAGMESAGYIYGRNMFVPEEHMFIRYMDEQRNIGTHHIHCYLEGNHNLKATILFCEYLNAHPEIAEQYNDLKLRLASDHFGDRVSYTKGKTDFINKIVSIAEEDGCII